MRRLLAAVIACLAVLAVVPDAASAAPTAYVEGVDEQSVVFDPMNVAAISLTMDQSAIDALSGDPRGAYQPARITITRKGVVWGPYDVGLRLKGVIGSYRWLDQKAGFKIKLNFADPELRYHGLKKLTVNNMVQDPSYIHEVLAYRVFRAVGIPAPRVGYTNVSFNGESFGLYALIETYDKPMLKRWFRETHHLYEGSYWMDLSPGNADAFEVDEGDPLDRSDLRRLINAANSPGAWWAALGRVADRHEFVKEWATELFLGHWDGYAATIKNNYFLHADGNGRFTMMPWGTDQTFGADLSYTDTWDRSILFTRCMSLPACWMDYHVALSEVRDVVTSLDLDRMAADVSQAIHRSLLADPRRDWGWCDDSCRQWATESAEGEQMNARVFLSNRLIGLGDYLASMTPSQPGVIVRPKGTSALNLRMTGSAPAPWRITRWEVQSRESASRAWRTVATPTTADATIRRPRDAASMRVRACSALNCSAWTPAMRIPAVRP